MTLGGRRRGIRVLAPVLLTGTLLPSCVASPDDFYASHPRCSGSHWGYSRDPTACLDRDEVRTYLDAAQSRLRDAWRSPKGIPTDAEVTLSFRLESDGSLRCLSLSVDSERTLARSALAALERVTPFPPVPSNAICLIGLPILIRAKSRAVPEVQAARRHGGQFAKAWYP